MSIQLLYVLYRAGTGFHTAEGHGQQHLQSKRVPCDYIPRFTQRTEQRGSVLTFYRTSEQLFGFLHIFISRFRKESGFYYLRSVAVSLPKSIADGTCRDNMSHPCLNKGKCNPWLFPRFKRLKSAEPIHSSSLKHNLCRCNKGGINYLKIGIEKEIVKKRRADYHKRHTQKQQLFGRKSSYGYLQHMLQMYKKCQKPNNTHRGNQLYEYVVVHITVHVRRQHIRIKSTVKKSYSESRTAEKIRHTVFPDVNSTVKQRYQSVLGIKPHRPQQVNHTIGYPIVKHRSDNYSSNYQYNRIYNVFQAVFASDNTTNDTHPKQNRANKCGGACIYKYCYSKKKGSREKA